MADEPIADLTVGPPGAPEIDAELAGGLDEFTDDELGALETVGVDPATVRQLLEAATAGVHHAAGHPEIPDHWKATRAELDQASTALARIASRSPVMARALGGDSGDGLVLVLVGGQYVIRNLAAARAVARHDDGDPQHEDRPTEDAGSDQRGVGAAPRPAGGSVPATLRLGSHPDGSASG